MGATPTRFPMKLTIKKFLKHFAALGKFRYKGTPYIMSNDHYVNQEGKIIYVDYIGNGVANVTYKSPDDFEVTEELL